MRDLAPAIDALFADALGELGAPGIAYGIALDGELVHAGGCGARDLESGTAPDADTAFRICSMTKSFMAMTVLSLRDEGRLDIDAPLGDVVAELAPLAEAGPDAPPVTVRQLLTMDAGLPQDDPWADRLMAHDREWVTETLFSRGATRSRAPGTFFEYSNYSWAALGRVVATVTGQRHQDVVRERVLDPLALTSTVWSAGDLPAQRIATGYRPAGEGFTAEVPLADGGDFAALGGLYSTRARPRALERRVPRRRAAARRPRACAREPRDAARDAARTQCVRARRRVAVAGRAAGRDRGRLRLRADDLARARRPEARRASRRPAGLRHADALGARARA